MNNEKPKKWARSRSETVRTWVSIAQLVIAVATLLLVLYGQGLINW